MVLGKVMFFRGDVIDVLRVKVVGERGCGGQLTRDQRWEGRVVPVGREAGTRRARASHLEWYKIGLLE